MASVWRSLGALIAALLTAAGSASGAAEGTTGLHDRPVLVVDPGMHTASIRDADVDRAGRWLVTGSHDKTVRLWSLDSAQLKRTIRLSAGPGHVGKVYAVAIDPAGETIAVGGWTHPAPPASIYLFRRDGTLLERLADLPDVVLHLAFSPDGGVLAATLGGGFGLRLYDRYKNWQLMATDTDYGDHSHGAMFAANGQLATTSYDGQVRLYNRYGVRLAARQLTAGERPFDIAFSPDGNRLAVGFVNKHVVIIIDGNNLMPLITPEKARFINGDLSSVVWSTDGQTLFAAGSFGQDGFKPVVAWDDAGRGARRLLTAGNQATVVSLEPLSDGALLVVAGDPHWAVLNADGTVRSVQPRPLADWRAQHDTLAVSADGAVIDFGYQMWGEQPARINLHTLKLLVGSLEDGITHRPQHQRSGLVVAGWENTNNPTLNGVPLTLDQYEIARSLSIHPDGERFVLGAEWTLRAFDTAGELLWRQVAPGVVWAVSISGDGRLVVAAYADGTIRWHRMDDGRELLAFFPMANQKDWVAWTPEGFYGATAGAHGVLKWHVNRGWDQPAEAFPVSQFRYLRRPEALALVLQEMETARALGLANMIKAQKEVQRITQSKVPPGARLHLLTIGVGDYGENAAHLRLEYADKDAHDVASALVNTQGSGLYAEVLPQNLTNGDATRERILSALGAMRRNMENGSGHDLAVFLFSGHGALIDGEYYLLPHDVDARNTDDLKSNAIAAAELRQRLQALGQRGRVLALIDACHSGATTADGTALGVNGSLLKAALAATNVTVLTSSSSEQVSVEKPEWQNGAFTEVLLQAFGREADADRNGLLSTTELTDYIAEHLPRLTGGEQTPGIEVRFRSEVLVSGL